ncbi:MAG: N-6 DNA methylase [Candidatus Micrarchaeota archaeon]|nr:N-6 DNA methylase [Candidatus Micrarchaeota archaeon]
MKSNDEIKTLILELHSKLNRLPNKDSETEKKAEEYLSHLFGALGWDWLSAEVIPQKRVRSGGKTRRVDYALKRTGRLKPDFYIEVKKFSEDVYNPEHTRQALEYGKNSGIRWVVLTNFTAWRVFNSDYFEHPNDAELFSGFNLLDAAVDPEKFNWLMLFSREQGGPALDEYAKKHKKWRESESVEELLSEQFINTRKSLANAIREQNRELFDPEPTDEDVSVDSCVQHILDRLIFCRMLEDNGIGDGFRMEQSYEEWKNDKRVQFYREHLAEFWIKKMRKRYDSTIFDSHRIDGLTIKNEDFVPIFESFYVNPKTKLRYRFEAIPTDVLGHAYENYLSYKLKQTAKRTGLEKEIYKRKQSGIYYTPEFLVDHLVRATLGEKLKACKTPSDVLKLRVIDPACGSGTFLVRAFEEFKSWYLTHEKNGGGEQAKLDIENDSGLTTFLDRVLESCIHGIDLDLHAVRLTRLNLFLRAIDTPNQLPRLKILHKNSLVWDDDLPLPFKMERDFPLVAEQGGFDVVIGNPPWEKWKPDSQEFFEEFHEGFKSLPTKEAKKVIDELLKTRIGIKKKWEDKLREYETYSELYRRNYQFQSAEAAGRQVSGDLDLYKVFTERAYQLLKPGGSAGLVIPSGIYTDLGAKGLRTMLFDHCQIKELYSFENRKFVFQDIDQRYKFVLLKFEKGGKTKSFPCAFFLYSDEDLKKAIEAPTVLEVEFIRRSSPTSWSVLEIKSEKDKGIVEKLLKNPKIGDDRDSSWCIKIQSAFHMTSDSHLFREGKLGGIPLLEGKNIEHFTHQWKDNPTPQYTMDEKDVYANLKTENVYHKGYWMAYRLIASSTNYRTFISTIVPPGYVCGHSIAIVRMENLKELCYLCGVMNSFVIDYFMRQKVSTNVTMFNFLETPIPRISSGKLFDEIVKKTAQLVAITPEFDQLKKEIGISAGLKDENDRLLARAQLDVAVAKLYGITKEELAYILEKFPKVDAKQKELVLREY